MRILNCLTKQHKCIEAAEVRFASVTDHTKNRVIREEWSGSKGRTGKLIHCAERIGEKRIPVGLQGENKDSEKGERQLMVLSLILNDKNG
jgi:hypothetical protein